jgi:hypothetical protein
VFCGFLNHGSVEDARIANMINCPKEVGYGVKRKFSVCRGDKGEKQADPQAGFEFDLQD